MGFFSTDFLTWLDDQAETIDQHSGGPADELLKRIAQEDTFRLSLPRELGGQGTSRPEFINVLTELAEHSLTAAFISWGHATFIDNILKTDNPYFREKYLEKLLTGEYAGATGLSNAVKFLTNLEELNVEIVEEDGKLYLKGRLPWVTNLRADHFLAVFVAAAPNGGTPYVIAVPSEASELTRSKDLEFVALQGGNTAALDFDQLELKDEWILSKDAPAFLSQNRPTFLGYQLGMAFGLAVRSLKEVEKHLPQRPILKKEWKTQQERLVSIQTNLFAGLNEEDYFIKHPKELFQLRIDIVDVVAQSLLLELQAGGGKGYFTQSESGFIRRWREGAFLPIVSPSAVQLRHILAAS